MSLYKAVIHHPTSAVTRKSKREKGFIGFQWRRKLFDKIVKWKLVSRVFSLQGNADRVNGSTDMRKLLWFSTWKM